MPMLARGDQSEQLKHMPHACSRLLPRAQRRSDKAETECAHQGVVWPEGILADGEGAAQQLFGLSKLALHLHQGRQVCQRERHLPSIISF